MRHGLARYVAPLIIVAFLTLASCSSEPLGKNLDPDQVDAVDPPELGACRVLTPDDVARPTNATLTVKCDDEHTAQTYAVGQLPGNLFDAGYTDRELGAWAFKTCSTAFEKFLGADESLAMRSILSWAWFRPSQSAWDDGARWYRCDVVGGGEQSKDYVSLPVTASGLLLGRPDDRWMVCVAGPSVTGSVKIPCTQTHDWRAVTTIKLGEPGDPYPGDRVAEVTTRDYCSRSVSAWLSYPLDFDFAYTWFHEAEWQAGNRRSICWAATAQ